MSFDKILMPVRDQYPTLYEQTIGKGNNVVVKIRENVFW